MSLEYTLQPCVALQKSGSFLTCVVGVYIMIVKGIANAKCSVTKKNWITQNGASANINVIHDLEYDKQIDPEKILQPVMSCC